MGNYKPMTAQERQRGEALLRAKEVRKQTFPAIERPCGTPGAVYTIIVDGDQLCISVKLPFQIETAIPAEAKEAMKKSLHDGILPVIERFYRDVWDGTLAGEIIDGDREPMPKRWELLFTNWIRRCFRRGEGAQIDGRYRFSYYELPASYQWPGPDREDVET